MSQRTVMFHDLFAHNARSAQVRGIFNCLQLTHWRGGLIAFDCRKQLIPEAWAYRCGSALGMVRTGPYDMPRRPGSTAFDKSKAINPRESCRAPYSPLTKGKVSPGG